MTKRCRISRHRWRIRGAFRPLCMFCGMWSCLFYVPQYMVSIFTCATIYDHIGTSTCTTVYSCIGIFTCTMVYVCMSVYTRAIIYVHAMCYQLIANIISWNEKGSPAWGGSYPIAYNLEIGLLYIRITTRLVTSPGA